VIEKNKDQKAILSKLGIDQLNEMQEDAHKAILSNTEIVLLSPTGTGKTLAFLLPIIAELDAGLDQVQALILVPSRELAMQIGQVVREMGSGFKINAVYGGRSGSKDKIDLKHPPAILIGTPGRIADHLRRENITPDNIKTLVLDEFDKSLEVGFEKEMIEIVDALPSIQKKILTSATQSIEIPDFVGIEQPENLNYLSEVKNQLKLNTILSPSQDKLDTLEKLLGHIGDGSGIVFCNFKDTIQIVSDFFQEKNIDHSCFYGGLEQIDRERALIKFRNGTHRLLIATDLAARGIDVPEMDFIIHYQLPTTKEEFTHRNGRTARMHSNGTAYILKWENEALPEFIEGSEIEKIRSGSAPNNSKWETLYISGGRKDKISKGDIAGLFFKQGKLQRDELGTIELKQDYAFVAVPSHKTKELIAQLNNSKIKKKKVRISLLD
jgi:superfamily II DNA/RNA helicase